MVIGIAGPTASGKTTVARMLEETYGAVRLRYSSILSEMAKERELDPDDKATLQGLFLTERETRGEDWLTKEMEERAGQCKEAMVVIEGNRRLVDVETLRRIAEARGDSLLLLFIDASTDSRFQRYNARLSEHNEPPISAEVFAALESNAAENELEDLKAIFAEEGLVINTDNKNADEVFKDVTTCIESESGGN